MIRFRRKLSKTQTAINAVVVAKIILLFAHPAIFVKKVSERKSIDFSQGLDGLQALDTFAAFSILSIPFAAIGINGTQALSLVNITASYFFYSRLANEYLADAKKRGARSAFALLMLAPGVFYFSMVALRDFFTAVLLFVLSISVADGKLRARWIISAMLVTLLTSLRPELLVYILTLMLTWTFVQSGTSLLTKAVVLISGPILLLVILQAALAGSFHLNVADLGAVKDVLIEPRFERQFLADGGNSAIMSLEEFREMPLVQILLVQFASTMLIPGLPDGSWLAYDWMAFFDSVVFISALVCILYLGILRRNREARFAALAIFLYLALITPFMVNYGNALRIRLPAEIMCYGFIYLSYARWYVSLKRF